MSSLSFSDTRSGRARTRVRDSRACAPRSGWCRGCRPRRRRPVRQSRVARGAEGEQPVGGGAGELRRSRTQKRPLGVGVARAPIRGSRSRSRHPVLEQAALVGHSCRSRTRSGALTAPARGRAPPTSLAAAARGGVEPRLAVGAELRAQDQVGLLCAVLGSGGAASRRCGGLASPGLNGSCTCASGSRSASQLVLHPTAARRRAALERPPGAAVRARRRRRERSLRRSRAWLRRG